MPDPVVDPNAPPAPTPAATWYSTVTDPDLIGHIQQRGWDTKDPAAVALEAAKAHREAERRLGVPADQLVRWPKDASDEANWAAVRERLGVPKEATGYDFANVKFTDGSDLDERFVTTMRDTAVKLGLPAEAAVGVAQSFAKFLDDAEAAETAEAGVKLEAERSSLKQNWGTNYQANLDVAKHTAEALGVKPEAINALESQIGYAAVMEMFRTIGEKTGEARFVQSLAPGAGAGELMTVEQAQTRINDLKADESWVSSYLAGDVAKARQMADLQKIVWAAKQP
jgi:hypothetical protein